LGIEIEPEKPKVFGHLQKPSADPWLYIIKNLSSRLVDKTSLGDFGKEELNMDSPPPTSHNSLVGPRIRKPQS
jgi:hypothetical protein